MFHAVYTHHDRIVMAGAVPTEAAIRLPALAELRTPEFLSAREAGIVNVGGTGSVNADGEEYELETGACLYVGRGTTDVVFHSRDAGSPARFYIFSAPAHLTCPTALAAADGGEAARLGDPAQSNVRTLRRFIHEDGIASCQIVMGVTTLDPGNMWNTMPAHTHDRRTECYLYFGLPEDQRVVHLMGEPRETRHLVVANEEAVISPSWSIHCGVGTAAYGFVWAMAGENKTFADMDPFSIEELR